eukprot:SAG31_NODE_231_length_19768_cov_9.498170_16_plen_50_part_00
MYASQAAVVQAVAADGFGGSALDHADGFIHLSTASQAQTTVCICMRVII